MLIKNIADLEKTLGDNDVELNLKFIKLCKNNTIKISENYNK